VWAKQKSIQLLKDSIFSIAHQNLNPKLAAANLYLVQKDHPLNSKASSPRDQEDSLSKCFATKDSQLS
jgi:CDP-glycerol glycerophosphotransferase (TagB/SpsB family)